MNKDKRPNIRKSFGNISDKDIAELALHKSQWIPSQSEPSVDDVRYYFDPEYKKEVDLNRLMQEQALIDSSLDFIPGGSTATKTAGQINNLRKAVVDNFESAGGGRFPGHALAQFMSLENRYDKKIDKLIEESLPSNIRSIPKKERKELIEKEYKKALEHMDKRFLDPKVMNSPKERKKIIQEAVDLIDERVRPNLEFSPYVRDPHGNIMRYKEGPNKGKRATYDYGSAGFTPEYNMIEIGTFGMPKKDFFHLPPGPRKFHEASKSSANMPSVFGHELTHWKDTYTGRNIGGDPYSLKKIHEFRKRRNHPVKVFIDDVTSFIPHGSGSYHKDYWSIPGEIDARLGGGEFMSRAYGMNSFGDLANKALARPATTFKYINPITNSKFKVFAEIGSPELIDARLGSKAGRALQGLAVYDALKEKEEE